MPIGPQRREPQLRGTQRASDIDEMEESLLRAMEEDPRLASGVESTRTGNVLDFIQMTGLTTGRVPAAAQPGEGPDDPISFFEYGVRDVDGSNDPEETAFPELDSAAFRIDTSETMGKESRSIAELRQIIAEVAAMESDLGERTATPRAAMATAVASAASRRTQPPPARAGLAASPALAPQNAARAVSEVVDEPTPLRWDFTDTDPLPAEDFATVDSDPTLEIEVDVGSMPDEHDETPFPIDVDADDEDEFAQSEALSAQTDSPMKSPAGLAAARELLRELAQANDAAERAEQAFARATPAHAAPFSHGEASGAASSSLQEGTEDPTTHHALRRRRGPGARHWIARGFVLALTVGVGIGAFLVYDRAVQPPRAAYEAAEALIAKGRFEDASAAFIAFTQRFPGHPRRAEAMYMAGYALQLVPEDPAPRAKEAYTESIALLGAFVDAYPAHEKTPRAETIMGVSYYRTGRHLEAINVLGDPDRRLRDPGAYLTALRTLGRAYAAVNQMDNARSAFMRAGALESNLTPDEDYAELAGMYTQLAERSGDPAQRRRYFELAVEQWDFALQVPGLLKARKDDMKLLRDVAASKVDGGIGTAAQAHGEVPGMRVRTHTQ